MSAKITLYSEPHLIDKVKQYAKQHNTSVSKIVTNFFETIVNQENEESTKNTSKLHGLLKDTKIDKKEYNDYLDNKYS